MLVKGATDVLAHVHAEWFPCSIPEIVRDQRVKDEFVMGPKISGRT